MHLRGSVSDTTYSDTNGVSNADRDTLQTTETGRATWEFKPTLAAFTEQEFIQRDKDAVPPDGISRASTGTRSRVGLDFGATGAILRGTISVGYGRQNPDDSRLKPVNAFLFDSNLAWRPSEITSFLLRAQSDIYETTTELSGGVISHLIGLEARHAFRRYLIATAGLAYTHYDYDATPIRETELISYLGAEYYASPELVLFARYQHLNFDSNEVNRDYESDEASRRRPAPALVSKPSPVASEASADSNGPRSAALRNNRSLRDAFLCSAGALPALLMEFKFFDLIDLA